MTNITKQKLQRLFKSEILPENDNPYHFHKPQKASFSIEANNNMCGDKYTLYCNLNEGQITSVYFHGIGCALSKASISIMCKNIENLSIKNIVAFSNNFINGINQEHKLKHANKKIQMLQQLKHFDGRVDCIKLGWEALINHFENIKL